MKNKYYIFLIFFIVFAFLGASYVLALEQPISVPGVGTLDSNTELPGYITFLFKFGIYIAGALAVISFAIGAVGLINPNVEAHGDAKDRMKSAVIGLGLTLVSWLIINTINTQLTKVSLTPIEEAKGTSITIPGVEYFTQGGCGGTGSGANTASQSAISEAFAGKIASVKITNDPTNKLTYGIILHQRFGLGNGGGCTLPIQGEGCHTVDPNDTSAANIYTINDGTTSSGDGVEFFSEPFGGKRGSSAGFIKIEASQITAPQYQMTPNQTSQTPELDKLDPSGQSGQSGRLVFHWDNISQTEAYKKQFPNFDAKFKKDGATSMDINGKYLVAVYSSNSAGDNKYCQTFTENVENFSSTDVSQPGIGKLGDIYIIPIK